VTGFALLFIFHGRCYLVTQSSDSLSICMVGDVFISSDEDPGFVLRDVAGVLREADVTLANAEGAICDENVPPIPGKATIGTPNYLRWPPGAVRGLIESGVDAVSIANNHSGDFGDEGVLQTVQTLDRAGMPYAGGGKNIEEAHRPCLVERKGFKVALLSYTSCYVPVSFPATESKPGVAVIEISTAYEAPYNVRLQPGVPARVLTYPDAEDKERMLEDVRQVKQKVDFVVVAFHWGSTRRGNARSLRIPLELCSAPYILGYQEELARAAIDAGADFIWGHHPHELQGMEIYKGKLICYSLGNFAWDTRGRRPPAQGGGEGRTPRESDSMIIKCLLDKDKKWHYSYIPVHLDTVIEPPSLKPRVLNVKEGAYILSDIMEIHSRKYGTRFVEESEEVTIQ